jgi:hypothetical protein
VGGRCTSQVCERPLYPLVGTASGLERFITTTELFATSTVKLPVTNVCAPCIPPPLQLHQGDATPGSLSPTTTPLAYRREVQVVGGLAAQRQLHLNGRACEVRDSFVYRHHGEAEEVFLH